MEIVLHVMGHTDPLSSRPFSHLMHKQLSRQCHNISRPIRQMNPQFQKNKHRFQLVGGTQPPQVESIMCQADPSPQPVSPKLLSIQFMKAKHWWFHAASKQGHMTYCKSLVHEIYLVSDLLSMDPLEGVQSEEWLARQIHHSLQPDSPTPPSTHSCHPMTPSLPLSLHKKAYAHQVP